MQLWLFCKANTMINNFWKFYCCPIKNKWDVTLFLRMSCNSDICLANLVISENGCCQFFCCIFFCRKCYFNSINAIKRKINCSTSWHENHENKKKKTQNLMWGQSKVKILEVENCGCPSFEVYSNSNKDG